jgi:hypothetical protein
VYAGPAVATLPPPVRVPGRWAPPPLVIGAPAPATLNAGPRVQAWPDPRGAVRAAAYRTHTGYVVDWRGVGRFHLAEGGAAVAAEPYPGVPSHEVHDTYARAIAPLVWQAYHGEALHASAVTVDGRRLACCARSGTGKTTLAWAMAARGHTLVADDAVLLERSGAGVEAFAPPHDVRLRRPSALFFGLPDPGEHGRIEAPAPGGDAAPLGGILVLERCDGSREPAAEPLVGAEALQHVLSHAHCLDPTDQEARRRALACYLACIASAPVWRVMVPSGLERLPSVVALIERVARGAGS